MVSSPDISSLSGGGLCPGPILLTCTVTELPFLVWEREGPVLSEFARYNPDDEHAVPCGLPLHMDMDIPGIVLNITSVMPVAEDGQCPGIPECDEFNVVSILAANTSIIFRNFNGKGIRCGSSQVMSDGVVIDFTLIGEAKCDIIITHHQSERKGAHYAERN